MNSNGQSHMHLWRTCSIITACLWLATVAACAGQDDPAVATADEPAQAGDPAASELPVGHPSVATGESPMNLPSLPPGVGRGATGVAWDVPEGWTAEDPSSSMRRAQYRVVGPAGDAECVVFYFGPGQGGGVADNVLRWADQFIQPDGRPSQEVLETRQLQVSGMSVTLAEITGIYGGGMAMGGGERENMADHMLLGAVVEGPDSNWFFKFTGPRATVESQREPFEALIRSLRRGAST